MAAHGLSFTVFSIIAYLITNAILPPSVHVYFLVLDTKETLDARNHAQANTQLRIYYLHRETA